MSSSYAYEHGITLYIFGCFPASDNNFLYAAGEKSIIYLPNLKDLDAIVMAGDTMMHHGMHQELLGRLHKEATCPIVSIRCEEDGYYNVLVHDEDAMYEMSKHFIQEHHLTDICFVTGRISMIDAKRRFAGYKRAMKEAGVEVTPDMVYYGDYWRGHEMQIVDYFFNSRKHLPDAIICSNDYMALPLCDELKRRGYRIPEDIRVSGFDDLDDAPMHIPPLTSVNVPFDEMAKSAMQMAVALINGETIPKTKWIHTHACYRESCDCKSEDTIQNRDAYMGKFSKIQRDMKECINMGADFESAVSESECFEWVRRYLLNSPVKSCFICLKEQELMNQSNDINTEENPTNQDLRDGEQIRLCYYIAPDGRTRTENLLFNESDLLPESHLHLLKEKVSIFLPIHCKNEVYGYFIFQLLQEPNALMSEKFEFLSMYTGNALKRLYMHQNLYSMRDIMYLYLRDPLTEVYNRRGFDQNLLEIWNRAKKELFKIALVSMDMDGLKYINDCFGHQTGDEAIISIGKALSDSLKENEFCARMGGDEFMAVLVLNQESRVQEFMEDFRSRIMKTNEAIEEDYVVDASIGICIIEEQESLNENLRRADRLMYEDKKSKSGKQGARE